ncbi:TetR family transcriptional regulator [Acinetobacter calcoaceticus]|uniref:TetR family transcriptional regulator n=1 Tax=Acinetobacter calcoaceticus TaxID=471 RepID=A0A4R1XNT7_ACICA|nr:TetR family transcriptional regulator [Acinetobacter calcoaceticus]
MMNQRQQQAQQNREILMQSALDVFRDHGINAPLQLIIQDAQLGRATFYRNFADRRALVLALMQHALARLEKNAQSFSLYPDGFIRLVRNHIQDLPYLTALMEYWRVIPHDDPELLAIYQQRDAILQPLIDTAIKHHLCRSDLSPKDYALLNAILRASFQGHTEQAQIQLAERAVELFIHGIQLQA